MGAKYLPTIRDHKATQRFHQKQHVLAQAKKAAGHPAAKKAGKK
jgi:hypothetical protein